MTTREKIIVGAMCLTLVYGAYELFGKKGQQKEQPAVQKNAVVELRGFVADIGQKLADKSSTEQYEYMLGRAGGDWDKDPFIHSNALLTAKLPIESVDLAPEKKKASKPQFVYSGYLSLGDTNLAIINGMEYAVGESLPFKGYYVKSIAPQIVVVAHFNGSESLQLPLREVDSNQAY
jgi:hypothetical protein